MEWICVCIMLAARWYVDYSASKSIGNWAVFALFGQLWTLKQTWVYCHRTTLLYQLLSSDLVSGRITHWRSWKGMSACHLDSLFNCMICLYFCIKIFTWNKTPRCFKWILWEIRNLGIFSRLNPQATASNYSMMFNCRVPPSLMYSPFLSCLRVLMWEQVFAL